jgi:hypothetical protein
MNKYLVIINFRTLIALGIAIVTLWISYIFKFSYNIDLTLVSIAIIFPLVFNIRGSFQRRERALEYASQFRSALLTLDYYFKNSPKLTDDDKNEITNILLEISNELRVHLGRRDYDTKDIDDRVQKVFKFITEKDEFISARYKVKIIRFLFDLHESIENLHAIHVHRTIISLKA